MEAQRSTSNLRRFLALPGGERRLLLEAWWRLLAAAAGLRFTPRRTLARALSASAPPAGRDATPALHLPEQLALAVSRAAAHHLRPMTCLPRALALRRMLARRHVAGVIRIGVSKPTGAGPSIAAHAWVEVNGTPLGEPEEIAERFRPLIPRTLA